MSVFALAGHRSVRDLRGDISRAPKAARAARTARRARAVAGVGEGYSDRRLIPGNRRFVVHWLPKGGGGHAGKLEVFAENKARALTTAMKQLKGRFSKIVRVV